MSRVPPAERFWSKVTKGDGCWTWVGSANGKGYGTFFLHGKVQKAHRVAWALGDGGPIPPGMSVLHSCDNPSCVRPDHLFLGTAADNNADMIAKGRYRHVEVRGEEHGRAKLTERDVLSIREDRRSYARIAAEYGVHKTLIGQIKRGQIWAHISAGER